MSLTAQITHTLRVLEQDAFNAGQRTTTHRVATLGATGVTRHDAKLALWHGCGD